MVQVRHDCGLGDVVAIEILLLQNLLHLFICPCSQFRLNVVFINDVVQILGMIFIPLQRNRIVSLSLSLVSFFYKSEIQFQASILLKVGNVISVSLRGSLPKVYAEMLYKITWCD